MKIIIYEKLSTDWCSYKQNHDYPSIEENNFYINPFITAALLISQILGITQKNDEDPLFNEQLRPILKLVSYFSGYYEDKLFVPFTGISNCKLDVDIDPKIFHELKERFEKMKNFRVQEFGIVELYERPDFIIINCYDYYPMEGVAEALYAGFFVKDLEKWNFYFGPRDQVPADTALESAKGIIVTGSRHCSYVPDGTWKESLMTIFQDFISHGRLLGICFGHQLIARAFHGETSRNPSNRYIYKKETISGPTAFNLMESHGDCVSLIPPNFLSEFSSNSCQVESLRLSNKILTFQGHPEFTVQFIKNFHLKSMKMRGNISDKKFEKLQKLSEDSFDSIEIISNLNFFLRTGLTNYNIMSSTKL